MFDLRDRASSEARAKMALGPVSLTGIQQPLSLASPLIFVLYRLYLCCLLFYLVLLLLLVSH
jgi:hypothetical protein